jgi:hypothetical protein
LDFPHDAALHGLRAEHEAGDGDGDDEKRGEGENRVIREGCAHARHFVFAIFGISGFEQLEKRLGPPGEALARRIVRRYLAIGFAPRLCRIAPLLRVLGLRRGWLCHLVAESILCH